MAISLRRKRNKSYRPKPVQTCAVLNAVNRCKPMDGEQQTELGLAYWLAFDMHMTNPTAENWAVLATTVNLAIVLCDRGFGGDPETFSKAAEGLVRAQRRAKRTGSYALDGDTINALRVTLDWHDAQCRHAPVLELRNAVREVHRRADAGIAYGEAA